VVAVPLVVLACAKHKPSPQQVPETIREARLAVPSTARRLSRAEYDDTLRDLLGDTSNAGFRSLPEDSTAPFDNNYPSQLVSPALIDSVESLAIDASTNAIQRWQDPAVRAKYVPCTATGAGDADCLRRFITSFGRRALRRPLTEQDVTEYLSLQSFALDTENTIGFDEGLRLVIQALLQEEEFLYRVEIGTPVDGVPGVFKLNSFEVASRLSYFLWGTMPDDPLLDLAAAGGLSTPQQIHDTAASMLADPRARNRVDRYHALWLSYYQLPHPQPLADELRAESTALVNKIVFEAPQDYFNLFTADSTFVNDDLATHYGLPPPG
jgi:hypothetical protein